MPDYWLDLFSGRTWKEFLDAGADVSGFRAGRWPAVQRIKVGDVLLCYMTGLSRFVGALEVTKPAYRDTAPIWHDEDFPCRLGVARLVELTPETGVPILDLRQSLSFFNPDRPKAWTGRVRGSPSRWKASDGEVVMSALREAAAHPVRRPVDRLKLDRRPQALRAPRMKTEVTIPPRDEETAPPVEAEPRGEGTEHTEIQWLLLKLGSDIGFDVWAARGDRNREWKGNRFPDLPKYRSQLPRQFDEATNRTIENIDVG